MGWLQQTTKRTKKILIIFIIVPVMQGEMPSTIVVLLIGPLVMMGVDDQIVSCNIIVNIP